MKVSSFLQDIALELTTEVVVQAAPLLAQVLPVRHAAIWTGEKHINRDHHNDLLRLIAQREPDPIDENALKALLDPDYASGLEEYDKKYQELSAPIWDEQYLCSGKNLQDD